MKIEEDKTEDKESSKIPLFLSFYFSLSFNSYFDFLF